MGEKNRELLDTLDRRTEGQMDRQVRIAHRLLLL